VQAVPWAVPKVNCGTNKADFNVPERTMVQRDL